MRHQYWFLFVFQFVLFVLFSFLTVYEKHHHQDVAFQTYGLFQDIHVMIFIGFGFLMVFLKKYGYSSVGFNFLLSALMLQWSILCRGLFELNEDYKIEIGFPSLYKADIATATVLISMGAVLGRISHTQLIVMGILEIVGYCFNDTLNSKYIKAVDNGGSIVLHTFGAYYGLAISYVSGKKQATSPNAILNNNPPESSYISNVLAMIGTLFLWVYWPSFNSIEMENDKNHRAVINTYLSLAASCVITFAASQFSSKEHKFSMTHVQNATLAGGVAIGACAQLMIQPFGAILIGIIAGLLSVYGYTKYSKFLETYGIKDTCGVHNLHGLPGILGGIAASVLASIASEQQYGKTLYEVYPARATPVIELTPEYIPLDARNGRSAGEQAGYQALIIIVTLATALTTGLISGFILNLNLWNDMVMESYYDDSIFWEVPNDKLYSESLAPFKWKLHEKLYDKNPSKISII